MGWQELAIVSRCSSFSRHCWRVRLLRAEVVGDSPVRNQTANAGTNNTTSAVYPRRQQRAAGRLPQAALDGIDAAQGQKNTATIGTRRIRQRVGGVASREGAGTSLPRHGSRRRVRSIWPKSPGSVGGYGALTVEAPGEAKQAAPQQNPAECDPAAFFDALIGQQDRHEANYRWQPGHPDCSTTPTRSPRRATCSGPQTLCRRDTRRGRAALDPNELALLRRLRQPSNWWTWLGMMLRDDQYKAFENRIDKMLQAEQLLQPLEF